MNLVVENLPNTVSAGSSASGLKAALQPAAQTTNPQPQQPERPQVQLPGPGREISEFASDIGAMIGPKQIWFRKGQQVVEVRSQQFSKSVRSVVFHPLTATETRTVIEDYVQTGYWKNNEEGHRVFTAQSMSTETSAALLSSPQLKRELPVIERILDVPIPFLHEGTVVFAEKGYDERLHTYCPLDAPQIAAMSLEKAKQLLKELQRDFCFANDLKKPFQRRMTIFNLIQSHHIESHPKDYFPQSEWTARVMTAPFRVSVRIPAF